MLAVASTHGRSLKINVRANMHKIITVRGCYRWRSGGNSCARQGLLPNLKVSAPAVLQTVDSLDPAMVLVCYPIQCTIDVETVCVALSTCSSCGTCCNSGPAVDLMWSSCCLCNGPHWQEDPELALLKICKAGAAHARHLMLRRRPELLAHTWPAWQCM